MPWAVIRIAVPVFSLWNSLSATAGTRAMNGDSRKAVTPMRKIAIRHPGSRAAVRAPSLMRAQRPPVSPSARGGGSRTKSKAMMTAKNEAAFSAKASV